jgi:hypothetical protein
MHSDTGFLCEYFVLSHIRVDLPVKRFFNDLNKFLNEIQLFYFTKLLAQKFRYTDHNHVLLFAALHEFSLPG